LYLASTDESSKKLKKIGKRSDQYEQSKEESSIRILQAQAKELNPYGCVSLKLHSA
jgi:hypothetical protein